MLQKHAGDSAPKKTLKLKTCRVCKVKYQPKKPLQIACSLECALVYGKKVTEKNLKKETREKLLKLKTRSEWLKETQAVVNRYVRERDKDLPCISCGIVNPVQFHSGHYLSRGAHPELSLEPRNIHKQCSQCNDYLSGNQVEMRKGIIARYGQGEIDWLESPHDPKKYTISELIEIKKAFTLKIKALSDK